MKKYKFTLLAIGFILLAIGVQMPLTTITLYWTSIIMCGVGGLLIGMSLGRMNKED